MRYILSEPFADEVFYRIDGPLEGNSRGQGDSRALFKEGSIERNACLRIVRTVDSPGLRKTHMLFYERLIGAGKCSGLAFIWFG